MSMSEIDQFINVLDTEDVAEYLVCTICGSYNHPRKYKCTCGRKTAELHLTVRDFEASWAEAHTAHQ